MEHTCTYVICVHIMYMLNNVEILHVYMYISRDTHTHTRKGILGEDPSMENPRTLGGLCQERLTLESAAVFCRSLLHAMARIV